MTAIDGAYLEECAISQDKLLGAHVHGGPVFHLVRHGSLPVAHQHAHCARGPGRVVNVFVLGCRTRHVAGQQQEEQAGAAGGHVP